MGFKLERFMVLSGFGFKGCLTVLVKWIREKETEAVGAGRGGEREKE